MKLKRNAGITALAVVALFAFKPTQQYFRVKPRYVIEKTSISTRLSKHYNCVYVGVRKLQKPSKVARYEAEATQKTATLLGEKAPSMALPCPF